MVSKATQRKLSLIVDLEALLEDFGYLEPYENPCKKESTIKKHCQLILKF